MYDAVVVGARCAGSAVARTLALAGRRVLLVDKGTFPADTMSTLYLQPAAIARLREWKLLDRVHATGCPAMSSIQFVLDDVPLQGFATNDLDVRVAYSPRRQKLDKLLVDSAVEAGAELREAFTFEDVVRDGDRVVGIRGHDKGGATVTEKARIVIGADGMRSSVARAVGAELLVERPPLACWYYAFYSGIPLDTGYSVFRNARAASLWPTNDGAVIAIAGWPRAMFGEIKEDLEASFLAAFDIAPELAARLRAGKREERFVGSAELASFVRRSHGPGWALAGDAGYHKDPCTAQGISDALVYGEQLAHAIASIDDPELLDAATAAYQAKRDASTRDIFEFTYNTSRLQPMSERTATLMRAVAQHRDHTERFLGVISGTVRASDFFSPTSIARILA